MPVEVTTTIDGLNELWPLGGDQFSEIEQHLSLIKDVVKKALTGSGGAGLASAINSTSQELSFAQGLASSLQQQLDSILAKGLMVGDIIMYSGVFTNIPSHYALCNGALGTPNLVNKFIYGTNIESEIGDLGGDDNSIVVSHTHSYTHGHGTRTTSTTGDHAHLMPLPAFQAGAEDINGSFGVTPPLTQIQMSTEPGHTHTVTINQSTSPTDTNGTSGIGLNKPAYYKLAYIQRIS